MEFDIASIWSTYIVPWGLQAVIALLIFYVGRKVAHWLSSLAEKGMRKQVLDELLIRLAKKALYYSMLVIVLLAALDQLGVDTTSALAALGAAGLAVGLALKDSLSNFAAGVMIVIFHPFRLGDYVEAAGTAGSVVEVDMFTTTLRTPDNKRVLVPNRLIYSDTIINYSAEDTRRVDMVFGIAYDDDIEQARGIIEAALAADTRILQEPASTVAVSELADSSVNFVVRPWVKKEDYWGVYFAMMEQIKLAFDKNGISIPFPQQDVYMHEVASSQPSEK